MHTPFPKEKEKVKIVIELKTPVKINPQLEKLAREKWWRREGNNKRKRKKTGLREVIRK